MKVKCLGTLLGLAFSCASVACGDPLGIEQNELDRARALWRDAEITDYTYRFQRLCFCPNIEPVIVEVGSGRIISVTDETTQLPVEPPSPDYFLTIDGIFSTIQDAIEREAFSLTAVYHSTLGYPTAVDIDYLENAVDEEMSFRASRLVQH